MPSRLSGSRSLTDMIEPICALALAAALLGYLFYTLIHPEKF